MRLSSIVAAAALAMVMSGLSVAAEEQSGGQQPSAAQQSGQSSGQAGQSSDQAGQSGSAGLQAALKKCEQMSAGDKKKCIDAAKKKHGQM
ncbi:MAG TPA: hypothetical protein VFB54_19320 [Burkholderiales bacterium]|nr:hypothetical protein [Burkholderiales bacterium]